MTIYKFPSDAGNGRDPKKEKKHPIHQPEFIDIEELHQKEGQFRGEEPAEIYTSVDELETINLPVMLRIFTVGISFALFAGSFLLFVLSAFMAFVSLITFFKAHSAKKRLLRYWKYCKRMFVTALGLMIMSASPPLGMGFIALYFTLQGETVESHIIGRFFRRHK